MDFPGGTLAEFYRGISAQPHAEHLPPLMISEAAEQVRMQPVTLRGSSLWPLLELPARLIPGVIVSGLHEIAPATQPGEAPLRAAVVIGIDPSLVKSVSPPATFDLDFPGGSLAGYVAAIRKAQPKANIVVSPGSDRAPVPELQLRDVTAGAAMKAIGFHQQRSDGTMHALQISATPIAGSSEEVIRAVYEDSATRQWETKARVWSLAGLLQQGATSEELLTAIEAALSVYNRDSMLKYHEPTSLLIVRGDEQQLALIDQTVDQILESLWTRSNEPAAGNGPSAPSKPKGQ
ncbi:MAG: hypothetical protein AB7G17_02930 [Phycisphaerales bacterium]